MLIHNPLCNQCTNKALYNHIHSYLENNTQKIEIEYKCDTHKCISCDPLIPALI